MKFKTCKFNVNRDASDIAMPCCKWEPPCKCIPPHYGWKMYEVLTEELCEDCKCYEKDETVKRSKKRGY